MEGEDKSIDITSFFVREGFEMIGVDITKQVDAAFGETGLDAFDERVELIEEVALAFLVVGEDEFDVENGASARAADLAFDVTHSLCGLEDFFRHIGADQARLVEGARNGCCRKI